MTDFRRQISEDITYEDSERRLIVIGSIFALCCLLVSTVFVIWIIRIYGKFITPRLISVPSKILRNKQNVHRTILCNLGDDPTYKAVHIAKSWQSHILNNPKDGVK